MSESAIERMKADLEKYPPLPGCKCGPTFSAGPGAFPSGVVQVLVELVERVEALEAERA